MAFYQVGYVVELYDSPSVGEEFQKTVELKYSTYDSFLEKPVELKYNVIDDSQWYFAYAYADYGYGDGGCASGNEIKKVVLFPYDITGFFNKKIELVYDLNADFIEEGVELKYSISDVDIEYQKSYFFPYGVTPFDQKPCLLRYKVTALATVESSVSLISSISNNFNVAVSDTPTFIVRKDKYD